MVRTNIEIDDKLMADTLRVTGIRTKREAVEAGLHLLLRFRRQAQLREMFGRLPWTGDLDAMRCDEPPVDEPPVDE
nr:type II toxin-antitoxin system VapB family antitoxin [Chiayiivirga flava]